MRPKFSWCETEVDYGSMGILFFFQWLIEKQIYERIINKHGHQCPILRLKKCSVNLRRGQFSNKNGDRGGQFLCSVP